MARPISTSWFSTYLKAEQLFSARGSDSTTTSIGAELGVKPKLLGRMVAAGRFLRRTLPNATAAQVRCSYVHFETLEKISRISPDVASSLAEKALSNTVSIADLTKTLESLRQENPSASPLQMARAQNRREALSFNSDLDRCLLSNPSDMFGIHDGAVLPLQNPALYEAPRYVILDKGGKVYAQILCKRAGQSKDPLRMAMDLYDLAKARRADAIEAKVWIILPALSEVMELLAEIAVQDQACVFGQDWLYLGYLAKDSAGLRLHTLFEREYLEVYNRIVQGQGRVTKERLSPKLKSKRSGGSYQLPLPLRFRPVKPSLKKKARAFDDLIIEQIQNRVNEGTATAWDKKFRIAHDFSI